MKLTNSKDKAHGFDSVYNALSYLSIYLTQFSLELVNSVIITNDDNRRNYIVEIVRMDGTKQYIGD
jgi:hypothetical protein